MNEIMLENEIRKSAGRTALGICAAFSVGFILGAAVVAIIDYHDGKKEQLKKIKRDSDENYIYSV